MLGEDDEGEIPYHLTLLDVAAHTGSARPCAQRIGRRRRARWSVRFRYVREDFFLGTQFDNRRHLERRVFDRWRAEVANQRQHGTTRRVVEEAFTEEVGQPKDKEKSCQGIIPWQLSRSRMVY